MKVRFYVDIDDKSTPITKEFLETHGLQATTKPNTYVFGRRVAFDVDLPFELVPVLVIQDGKVVE